MAKYSIILCSAYIIFLLFGGFIFMYLEWEDVVLEESSSWIRLKAMAIDSDPPESEDELNAHVGWVLEECPNLPGNTSRILTSVGDQSEFVGFMEEVCPNLKAKETKHPWSFIDALYFSMTVSTTIGYGHISPSTSIGRVVCILYSLVGIPMTGMLLAWSSGIFGGHLFQLFKSRFSEERQRSKLFIASVSTFYILTGFVVFIFLPALIFIHVEEWSYLEGVYYAYITLTTIGFGDFVTGSSLSGAWRYVYQICVILWILIGLGYWVMVANFIQRALKSKRIHDLAKRASALKKLMSQVSHKNQEPQFVSQSSKATLNFLLQLSNTLVAPEMTIPKEGSPTTPTSPQIPGIAALFQQAGARGNFNHFLSAGVMGMNMKTDPNGNSPEEAESTQSPPLSTPAQQESPSEECDSIQVQMEPIPEAQEAGTPTSVARKGSISSTAVSDMDTQPTLTSSVEDIMDEDDKPFMEWLSLYQDPDNRDSLITSLSGDLEKLQTSMQVANDRPLSVGCSIEAVR